MATKKTRIALLFPSDVTTDERSARYCLYFDLFERLSDEFEVTVIGRIPEDHFRGIYNTPLGYLDFFASDEFSRNSPVLPIEEAEEYLGIPYNYLFFSNQRRWRWLDKGSGEKKFPRYVAAWKRILSDFDVVIPSFDNLFFMHVAENVARRMGLGVMKIINGRLVDNSLIFWGMDNMPIYHNGPSAKSDISVRFEDRVLRNKTNVKKENGLTNSKVVLSLFLTRGKDLPRKVSLMLRKNRSDVDADVPSLPSKYSLFISFLLRLLIYPAMHSLLTSRSREERFFLFPLHYEWEANLAYREPFLDQLQMARHISDCLPAGTYLYVKGHPHWRNVDQSLRAMLDLRMRPNVRIIDHRENTSDLVKRCLGAIIINSTVGYEAILLKKPLVVLGHEAFREVGIDVKDLSLLPRILTMIKSGELKPDHKRYESFLERYTSNIFPIGDPESMAKEFRDAIRYLRLKNGPDPQTGGGGRHGFST